MQDLPPCPKCNDACTYHDGAQLICPSCLYEWNENELKKAPKSKTSNLSIAITMWIVK